MALCITKLHLCNRKCVDALIVRTLTYFLTRIYGFMPLGAIGFVNETGLSGDPNCGSFVLPRVLDIIGK